MDGWMHVHIDISMFTSTRTHTRNQELPVYALGQDPIVIPEAGFLRQPQLVGHPVCVFMCVCVCVCVHIYICIHLCLYVCMYIMHAYTYTS